MIARGIAALLLAGTLAGAASDPLAGRVAGEPQDCIDPVSIDGPQIVDARTILYRRGARLYRTGPVGSCPALRPLTTLIVDIRSGQLCRNDRFRVLEPGVTIPSGYCRFSTFTPYDRP